MKLRNIDKRKVCNMNPIYNIWDYNYIQQQAQQHYHENQVQQVMEAVHKLNDFLDSVDKVDPGYQGALTVACCAALVDHANKHKNI